MNNPYMIPARNGRISDAIAWIRPVLIGAAVGFMLMSFQNCQRVAVSDLRGNWSAKLNGAPDVDPPYVDPSTPAAPPQVPSTQMPNGDVIVPATGSTHSVYVCPPGTQPPPTPAPSASSKINSVVATQSSSSNQRPNSTTAVAVSYGGTAQNLAAATAASSSSNSSGSYNNVTINQSGGTNYAYVYQSGGNNHSQVTQNGTNNTACVVQVGEKNDSAVDQTGDNNSASVKQIGGQSSRITQNGSPGVSHDSAEACGCQLIHCDSANADLDPTCRQAVASKVIAK